MAKRALICDLDNTLYDWVAYFVPAFYAMADTVVEITGCDRQQLLDDFREVHRKVGNSEEPYALLHTRTVRRLFAHRSSAETKIALDRAFHAFNSTRKRTLVLYPGVRSSLEELRKANVKLIAHTESKLYGALDRLRRLDLMEYFSKVYCRERSVPLLDGVIGPSNWFDGMPLEKVVELSHHQAKPNPDVLLEICAREGISITEGAYVGDSLAKDVAMARRVGMFAIWAEYGSKHSPEDYDALVRISHWSEEDVQRERRLSREASGVQPDSIARTSFAEVPAAIGIG